MDRFHGPPHCCILHKGTQTIVHKVIVANLNNLERFRKDFPMIREYCCTICDIYIEYSSSTLLQVNVDS